MEWLLISLTLTIDIDGQVPIEEAIRSAQSLLESRQTTTTVNDFDRKIRAHHSNTISLVTSTLIPLVIPILVLLLRLGFLGGGYLVPGIQSMASRIMNGLEEVETEQGHVFNLSRLNGQLLDDRLQASLTARQTLEAHLTAATIDAEKKLEVKDLLARLDKHSEQLVRELHRRQPAVEDARQRVRLTEDFKEELRRALETRGESWLEWLASSVQSLLTWLWSLVVDIGRSIAELASSMWT